jgi:hypothetical protein
VSALDGTLRLTPAFLGVGFILAACLGLPAYLVLRWKKRVSAITCVLGGFAVVAVPVAFVTWPLSFANSTTSIDGVTTIVGGVATAAGWALFAAGLIRFGLLGAIGGMAFWALLAVAGEFSRSRQTSARTLFTSVFSVLVLAVTLAIYRVSTPRPDVTCHGKYGSVGLNIDLQVQDGEWDVVRQLLQRYAAKHELLFRDLSETRPDVVRLLYLSVCDDTRIHLVVNEQRWANYGYRNQIAGRGIGLIVYHPSEEPSWRPLARDLVEELSSQWPEAVKFRDGSGYVVPMPVELDPR